MPTACVSAAGCVGTSVPAEGAYSRWYERSPVGLPAPEPATTNVAAALSMHQMFAEEPAALPPPDSLPSVCGTSGKQAPRAASTNACTVSPPSVGASAQPDSPWLQSGTTPTSFRLNSALLLCPCRQSILPATPVARAFAWGGSAR